MKISLSEKEFKAALVEVTGAPYATLVGTFRINQPQLFFGATLDAPPQARMTSGAKHTLVVGIWQALRKKYGLAAEVTESDFYSHLCEAVDLLHDAEKRSKHPFATILPVFMPSPSEKGNSPLQQSERWDVSRTVIASLLALCASYERRPTVDEATLIAGRYLGETIGFGKPIKLETRMVWTYEDGALFADAVKAKLKDALLESAKSQVGCFAFERLEITDYTHDSVARTVTAEVDWLYLPVFVAHGTYSDLSLEEIAELFRRCRMGWFVMGGFSTRTQGASDESWRRFSTTSWEVLSVEQGKTGLLPAFDLSKLNVKHMRAKEELWDWHVGAERVEFSTREDHPDMLSRDDIMASVVIAPKSIEEVRFRAFQFRNAQPALAAYLGIPVPEQINPSKGIEWEFASRFWLAFDERYGAIPAASESEVRLGASRVADLLADSSKFNSFHQYTAAAASHELANLLGRGVDFPNTDEGRPVWANLLTVIEVLEAKRLASILLKAA